MRSRWLVMLSVFAVGCGEGAIVGSGGGGGAAGGGVGGAGGAGGGGGGAASFDGLPCDVATVLAAHCVSCHGTPLSGGATVPLTSRADLVALSPNFPGQSIGSRCVTRMRMTAGAMPPAPLPAVPAADLAAFDAWVTAGMPVGSCTTTPDAGMVTLTCASGQSWTDGNNGEFDMNPGWACVSCHLGNNFNGQNPPPPDDKIDEAWFFMGTVYPALNERDRCVSEPPATVRVEILDTNGNVVLTMTPSRTSGNFASDNRLAHSTRAFRSNGAAPSPYRARVVNGAASLTMMTAQTSGDCNTCHTERGANGAAGRIVYPAFIPVDAGPMDAGVPDAGTPDAGSPDAGTPDAGGDAGAPDAGPADAGATDAGVLDAGDLDAGVDAGAVDAGDVDAGDLDAGVDAGAVDAGDPDAGLDGG
ncbi:MAG: hypothetical protein AB1938_06765 [Myxococcota bacterium]